MKKSVLLLGIVSLLTNAVFAQSEQKESKFR
jgi:hypothetical protein